MTICKAIRLLLVVLAPSIAFAQATLTGSPLTGDIRPIAVRNGASETNVLFAQIAAGAAADDDINNSLIHPIGGAQYFLAPGLAIQESRQQLQWNVSYLPTMRFYVPRSAHPDLFSQSVGGTLHYEVTKHLSLGLRQDYLHTDDPFQQLADVPFQPGIGLLRQPGVLPFGNFTRTQMLSQAQIDDRLTKHTSVGVSGSYMVLNSDGIRGSHSGLINTHDGLGSAYLSHQFTQRQTLGVQYHFLDILFPGRDTRTRTNGVLLFDQIAVNPHTTFSFFGGPEYSQIHNQLLLKVFGGGVIPIPMSSTRWSGAGGAILDYRRNHLALQASFVQRVSDGGGVQGAVEMRDAVVRVREKLARRWAANVDVEMTQRTLLNVPGVEKLQILNLGAGISYELAHRMRVRTAYQRLHDFGSANTLQFGNHNRVMVTVERDFTLPLGR